jgi:methionyl-tRNA synthetase
LPRTAETFYGAFNFAEQKAWDRVSFSDVVAGLTVSHLRVTAPITGGKPAPLFPKVEVR